MPNKTYNIETCITHEQINIALQGVFLKTASAYLEDQLKRAFEEGYTEVILNMKNVKHITGQCMQVIHRTLAEIYTTKKIVLICQNNSQVESLFLHLGFAQWFSYFDDEEKLTGTAEKDIIFSERNMEETELLDSAAA